MEEKSHKTGDIFSNVLQSPHPIQCSNSGKNLDTRHELNVVSGLGEERGLSCTVLKHATNANFTP